MKKLNRLMTAALVITCSVSMVSYGGTTAQLKQNAKESSSAARSTSTAGSAGESRTARRTKRPLRMRAGKPGI